MRLVAILALAICTAAHAQPHGCRAIDGDTIRCGAESIRLQRVYAAELDEPGGRAAKARLAALIASGEIWIERKWRDRYGRTVGNIYVDGARIRQRDIGPRAGRGSAR